MGSVPARSSACLLSYGLAVQALASTTGSLGCDAIPWPKNQPQWTRPITAESSALLPSAVPDADTSAEAESASTGTTGDPPAEGALDLERSPKRLTFPLKASTHLDYNLGGLEKLGAVAVDLEIPAWAAPGEGQLDAMQDSSLDVGWRCRFGATHKPCAVGTRLEQGGEIKAIRLFSGVPGPNYDEYPRIAKLRVHTDEGYADTALPDGQTFAYAIFGKPVATRSLVLEILETRGGRHKAPLVISDLEIYATDGRPREPLDIHPERVVVAAARQPWVRTRDGWQHEASYLAQLDVRGVAHRLFPGTAIYGRDDTNLLLIENIDDTDCSYHRGSYLLLDKASRVPAPIGDLGGLGGLVYVAKDGSGYVGGYSDNVVAHLAGVVKDGNSYKHRRTQRLAGIEAPDTLATWGFDTVSLPRGGNTLEHPPASCARRNAAAMGPLKKALQHKTAEFPTEWTVCQLGPKSQMLVTDDGPCGRFWRLAVVDDNGSVTAHETGPLRGSHGRLRRLASDEMLVELAGDDDTVALWQVKPDGLTLLAPGLSLATQPPAACRKRCDAPFRNTAAPASARSE